MYEKELQAMIKAAYDAEKVIKEIYAKPFSVEIKSDNSPVTAADKGADALIRKELSSSFPTYGLLTEESKDDKSRLEKENIFIVDPVDGTKEFVAHNGEFCTNIGLAHNHEVVAGVINVPMIDTIYYAIKGQGAYKMVKGREPVRIHVNNKDTNLTCLISKSFFNEKEDAMIKKHSDKIRLVTSLGAAMKFCAIAEGKAEVSYRMGSSTKEWDIAAGDIILSEAGGYMGKPDGTSYKYNRDDVYNREGYVLANKKENAKL
jgi:3'(2'), 5'-bisphosphate nucleotidase